jgi:FkbM family methyltransferase
MSAYTVQVHHAGRGILEVRFYLDRDDSHENYAYNFFVKNTFYEPEVAHLLLNAIKDGQFVVDVGANVGFFTVLMACLVGPSGVVLAIEPDAANLERLHKNLELNELDNVRVISAPVWSAEEEVTFYKNADNVGGHSLWDAAKWDGNKQTQLRRPTPSKFMATTLAKEIERVGRPCRLIKLDTEGADEPILRALGDSRPDFIVSESNPFGMRQFGCTNDTMRAMMKGYGYDCFLLSSSDDVPAMVPPNADLCNSTDDRIILNLLFSTLEQVGRAYPRVPRILINESHGQFCHAITR